MIVLELYKGQPGSPIAALINDISETDTEIIVSNGSYFPDPPNLATIYGGEDFETILYRSKNGNILSDITRAVEGTARAWRAGTRIARFYTAYDQEGIIKNIKENKIYISDTEPENGSFWLDTGGDGS